MSGANGHKISRLQNPWQWMGYRNSKRKKKKSLEWSQGINLRAFAYICVLWNIWIWKYLMRRAGFFYSNENILLRLLHFLWISSKLILSPKSGAAELCVYIYIFNFLKLILFHFVNWSLSVNISGAFRPFFFIFLPFCV